MDGQIHYIKTSFRAQLKAQLKKGIWILKANRKSHFWQMWRNLNPEQ